MFTPRAAVTGLIAVAVTAGVIALTVRLELDVEASFSLIVLLCTPIGLFGLARRHDMPSEKWIPLAAEERRAPRELTLEPVSFAVERSAAEGGRGDKRPARSQEGEEEGGRARREPARGPAARREGQRYGWGIR